MRGGLGNQLYQLCALDYFCNKYNLSGSIDLSHYLFLNNTRSPTFIDLFQLLNFANIYSIDSRRTTILSEKLSRKLPLLSRALRCRHLIGDTFQWPESVSGDRFLLGGYFQHHYIAQNSGLFDQLGKLAAASNLKTIDSVAIHLRLGDYSQPPYNSLYWLADHTYLKYAFRQLKSITGNTCFREARVFTDSLASAKELLDVSDLPVQTYRFLQCQRAEQDLLDLSRYSYKILSNSTFSLASYYIGHSNLAIIPRHWFKTQETPSSLFPLNAEANMLIYNNT